MSNTVPELTRKDMKAPDKFQVAATEAATWAAARRKPIVAALAALAGVLVVALVVQTWRSSSNAKAGSLLYRALLAASGEVSSVPLPNADVPLYKSEQEKQKAIADAAAKVRQEYGSSRAAATAALAEADARLRLGELDPALAGYQAFLSAASKDEPLRFAALDGVARVQEAKGQLAEAAQTWQQAGEVKAFADRAAIERARVLARAGQVEEARKILASFGDTFKASRLRAEADERLAKLGAK